jgi:hypothetical protein
MRDQPARHARFVQQHAGRLSRRGTDIVGARGSTGCDNGYHNSHNGAAGSNVHFSFSFPGQRNE